MYGSSRNTKETTPFIHDLYGVQTYAYWITKNYREAYNMFAVSGILLTMKVHEEHIIL